MGRDRLFTQGLRSGNRLHVTGRAAPFAVVAGRALERLDLQRHAVDGDHPDLLTGRDGRRPVGAGPPPGRRRR